MTESETSPQNIDASEAVELDNLKAVAEACIQKCKAYLAEKYKTFEEAGRLLDGIGLKGEGEDPHLENERQIYKSLWVTVVVFQDAIKNIAALKAGNRIAIESGGEDLDPKIIIPKITAMTGRSFKWIDDEKAKAQREKL